MQIQNRMNACVNAETSRRTPNDKQRYKAPPYMFPLPEAPFTTPAAGQPPPRNLRTTSHGLPPLFQKAGQGTVGKKFGAGSKPARRRKRHPYIKQASCTAGFYPKPWETQRMIRSISGPKFHAPTGKLLESRARARCGVQPGGRAVLEVRRSWVLVWGLGFRVGSPTCKGLGFDLKRMGLFEGFSCWKQVLVLFLSKATITSRV